MKSIKAVMDFDGTLTDEARQAEELALIAKRMLAEEILNIPLQEVEELYARTKAEILSRPHEHHWMVNGLPATYAYEGAYLLNTSIIQNIVHSNPKFSRIVKKRFPANRLDSVTRCSNHLFHKGTMEVDPHFLDGARELLVELIESEQVEPVILTNSETRKIEKNLKLLGIGKKGAEHQFEHEIDILGDTRQYHMDPDWDEYFEHEVHGRLQVLPVDAGFSIDLRRPIYYKALKKVMSEGYDQVLVVADGLSLAGALPLMMGLRFALKKTGYTPEWCQQWVASHPNGQVVEELVQVQGLLDDLIK